MTRHLQHACGLDWIAQCGAFPNRRTTTRKSTVTCKRCLAIIAKRKNKKKGAKS